MSCSTTPDKLKMCIAEDEEGDRLLYNVAFEELGFADRLLLFEDGDILMNRLKNWDEKCLPGLIVLDYNMPRKSGLETLKELKADKKLAVIPVAMFSTSVNEQDVQNCYDAGLSAFFYKTSNYEQLLTRIKILEEFFFRTIILPQLENR